MARAGMYHGTMREPKHPKRPRGLTVPALAIALAASGFGSSGLACGDSASRPEILKPWAHACGDSLESVYEAATAPSPWSAAMRGTIERCAYERLVTTEEMSADIVSFGYIDPGFSTDVHKVRLSYWTERHDGQPALTSAVLYIPETMRTSSEAPLVVLGHGSVGVADACAPSAETPEGHETGWKSMAYSVAGDGFLVAMPDFPGLGTEGAAAWVFSPDEAHSILDATRAVRLLGPDVVGDRNAIIGHSLGGHAVLSAHAAYDEYGAAGTIEGVVSFSGLYINNGAWAVLATDAGASLLNSTFYALTLMYHYGHVAAYEGEAAAKAFFLPEKADAIVDLLETECWVRLTSPQNGPPSIGLEVGTDAFKPEFIKEVGDCAFNSDFCDGPLAQLWRERWIVDRPAANTSIPIVHWVGALDDFLPPSFQQCGFDRLESQNAQQEFCVDEVGNHGDLLTRNAAWTRQYLASVLLDEAAPTQCGGLELITPTPNCTLPIPNEGGPGEP
jgi:hypothetical protein